VITPERLAEIEARTEAATAGPWTASGYDVYETQTAHGDVVAEAGLSGIDAKFIAHARADVPDLVAEVRRQRAAADATDDRFWDGFDAALTAVEEGQVLYGTTKKAVAALRVVSRVGREAAPVTDLADAQQQLDQVRANVTDAVAEHRNGDVVPVGAVMAALVISDQWPSDDDIKRGREVQTLLDGEASSS
jgi:hypothetical protein